MPPSSFPWRTFWLLFVAEVVSALAGLLYVLELLLSNDEIREGLETAASDRPKTFE